MTGNNDPIDVRDAVVDAIGESVYQLVSRERWRDNRPPPDRAQFFGPWTVAAAGAALQVPAVDRWRRDSDVLSNVREIVAALDAPDDPGDGLRRIIAALSEGRES